jgi:hypothetical protein
MNNDWRLAFMFDARDGNLSSMEKHLNQSAELILRIVGDARVRIGVVDTHPDLSVLHEIGRTVDGALEISVAATRVRELPNIAKALREPLQPICATATLEVMTGPFFPIVPVQQGDVFLSLAFRREQGTTSEEFRNWWLRQHSGIATPVLGELLLAYDQVHVDQVASESAALAFGVEVVHYDAYDNLTWANRDAFFQSISNQVEMARIQADEVGRIDVSSRRTGLMRRIY